MRIVVLDGYTLNPGDLSWADLEALGPLTVYDRTPPAETAARAAAAEIVLTNKTVLSREILRGCPDCGISACWPPATTWSTWTPPASGTCR